MNSEEIDARASTIEAQCRSPAIVSLAPDTRGDTAMTPAFAHQSGLADDPLSQGKHRLSRRTVLGAAVGSAVTPRLADAEHAARQPQQCSDSDTIVSSRIAIPQEKLDGLRARLRLTRRPEAETVPDWFLSVPTKSDGSDTGCERLSPPVPRQCRKSFRPTRKMNSNRPGLSLHRRRRTSNGQRSR
ncbi:hypothetical protein [Sphingomonas sanxanigenens]|uniref:hypothetical protein n=1 Tax=Sphingomonas sanxanigenens TaxID=397260 RepID=UPI001300CF32|nr:hypothetical protein [Sphingomonas sanxanigenens]